MTDDTIKFQCYEQTGCNVYHYEPEQPGIFESSVFENQCGLERLTGGEHGRDMG